jgi:hypothetical protein
VSNGEQINQVDRLNQIAQEATKEISQRFGFSKNVFDVRGGDGIEQSGSRTGEWILHFWYRGDYGLDARVIVTDESTDEEIRQAIISQIEPGARSLREQELGGKIEDFQATD